MKRIYARNCELVITSKQTEEQFINGNHYQGFIPSSVCFALKDENQIVEMMTFGKPRYNKSYDWELLRLCTKKDFIVVGGASKLLKAFTDNYEGSIISYCNESKFSGSVYEKLGFKKSSTCKSYHYEKDGKSYHRSNFQRRVLERLFPQYPRNEYTEKQIMELEGYTRVDELQSTWVLGESKSTICIYEIVCNGFHYIGQHRHLGVDNYAGSGTIIRRLTNKYPFTKTILIDGIKSNDDADKYEKCMIRISKALYGEKNINLQPGGRGYHTRTYATQGRKGTPHTEEFKERQRQRMLGKHRTEAQRLAVSIANTGRKHTKEWKEHNSEIMKEQYTNGRKVAGFYANPSLGGKANAEKVRKIKQKIRDEGLLCSDDIPKRKRHLYKVAYCIGQIKAYYPL